MPTSPIGTEKRWARPTTIAGFTLIEVLVVLIIMGVLIGMAMPRLTNAMSGRQLRSSAQQFKHELEAARMFALTRQTRCRVVIDANTGGYQSFYQPEPVTDPQRYEPVRSDGARPRTLGSNTRFGSLNINPLINTDTADPAIMFEPSGAADAAVVELTDDARTWTVRVASATGRIEILPGRPTAGVAHRIDLDLR